MKFKHWKNSGAVLAGCLGAALAMTAMAGGPGEPASCCATKTCPNGTTQTHCIYTACPIGTVCRQSSGCDPESGNAWALAFCGSQPV